jgi:hypothetical protein
MAAFSRSDRMLRRRVFLSYAHEDVQLAELVKDTLRRRGFAVWMDKHSIPLRADWQDAIRAGVREADMVIILLSHASAGSRWVLFEVAYAISHGKTERIIYAQLDPGALPPPPFGSQQILKMPRAEDFGPPLDALVRDLRGQQRHDLWKMTPGVGAALVLSCALCWSVWFCFLDRHYSIAIMSAEFPARVFVDDDYVGTVERDWEPVTCQLATGKYRISVRGPKSTAERQWRVKRSKEPTLLRFDAAEFH